MIYDGISVTVHGIDIIFLRSGSSIHSMIYTVILRRIDFIFGVKDVLVVSLFALFLQTQDFVWLLRDSYV